MLKLNYFEAFKLNDLSTAKGGQTTAYVSGSSSSSEGCTTADIQLDGDSTAHCCGEDDETPWGEIKWVN